MPFIQPYLCSNISKGFWSQLKKDRLFVSQVQTLPYVLYPYSPYRIVIIQNGYVISEAANEEESNQDWEKIHQTLIDAKVTIILKDTPYNECGKILLDFFTGLYESDKANTDERIKERGQESPCLLTSSSSSSSDDIFSFAQKRSEHPTDSIEPVFSPIFTPELRENDFNNNNNINDLNNNNNINDLNNNNINNNNNLNNNINNNSNLIKNEFNNHYNDYDNSNDINSYEMVNTSERGKKVAGDFVVDGRLQKLKAPNLNTQKEANWVQRYFVLKTHVLIELIDEVESSFVLADSTGRELGRSWVSLTSLSLSDTAVPSSSSSSSSTTNAFRPVTAAPGVIGYKFEVSSACTGGGSATLLAETVSDNIGWLEFLQKYAESRDTRGMEREGSLYVELGGGRWERRWVRIKDDLFEVHRREKKAVYPMASCTAICDRGLDVTVKFGAESDLVLRFTPSEWAAWIDGLRYSARVSAASSSLISGATRANGAAVPQVLSTEYKGDSLSGEADKELIEIEKIISDALKLDESLKKRGEEEEEKKAPAKRVAGPYFILAVDGGGMRGVMIAVILERIAHEFPDLLDRVDLFTGTSIGAIISSVLAFGHTPTMCRALLEGTSRYIFSKRPDASFTGVLSSAKFSNKSLARVLKVLFGKSTLGQAHKKLIIPAFLLDTNEDLNINKDYLSINNNNNNNNNLLLIPSSSSSSSSSDRGCDVRCMHNLSPVYEGENTGAHVTVVDAVMRSAAAPTFFPSYQNYVDGGMFAQDPSSVALSYAMSPRRDIHRRPEDIVLLSIGTGKVRRYYEDPNGHDYGYVQWGPKILNVLWDAMVLKSVAVCRELLGENYWRADPDLPREIPLDDRDQLPELIAEAQKMDLEPTFKWIRKHIYGKSDEKMRKKESVTDGNGFVTRLRSLSSPYRKVK